MEPWEHVVEIPEGREGTYEIKHFTRLAGKVERSNMRTAIMGGQNDPPLSFDRPTQWHRLTYEGGTWMTDLPIEQAQHDIELEPITSGRVLVGGLGVGYAANVLAAREDIDEVVVVEISPEVCKLVGPYLKDPDGKITLVNMDLFKFLEEQIVEGELETFDFAFYDIWQSDGEGTFHNTVVPLRKLSRDLVSEVVCWNENVMRGQLAQALHSRIIFTQLSNPGSGISPSIDAMATKQDENPYWNWAVPFWEAVRDGVIPALGSSKEGLSIDPEFSRRAGEYAGTYGTAGWERWWELVKQGRA